MGSGKRGGPPVLKLQWMRAVEIKITKRKRRLPNVRQPPFYGKRIVNALIDVYGFVMMLLFNVTAAIRANKRPSTVAPVFSEID